MAIIAKMTFIVHTQTKATCARKDTPPKASIATTIIIISNARARLHAKTIHALTKAMSAKADMTVNIIETDTHAHTHT